MNRADLIDAVLVEMERVWPGFHLEGTSEQYAWLREHYHITEVEDVQWQLIHQHHERDLQPEDLADGELMAFLEDDGAVTTFLEGYLAKYRSNSVVHERRMKPR